MTQSGIYAIWRNGAEQCYVGSSNNIDRRWKEHLYSLRNKSHRSAYLQRAWNKYGETAFSFAILEVCNVESLFVREQYFIDALVPVFNMSACADAPRRGVTLGPETRAKIVAARTGTRASAETRLKMSIAKKGKTHSEAMRAKMSALMTGNKRNLGNTHSAETRAKISAAHARRRESLKRVA